MADRPSNTDSSLVLGDAVPLNGDSLLNKISQAEKDVKLPHGVDLALSVVKSGDLKMAAGAGLLGQLKPAGPNDEKAAEMAGALAYNPAAAGAAYVAGQVAGEKVGPGTMAVLQGVGVGLAASAGAPATVLAYGAYQAYQSGKEWLGEMRENMANPKRGPDPRLLAQPEVPLGEKVSLNIAAADMGTELPFPEIDMQQQANLKAVERGQPLYYPDVYQAYLEIEQSREAGMEEGPRYLG
ncbi:hypothetical protein PSQ33_005394 [Pseudomonas aeruginosa]|uniref:hypothetical protein n=1 Tax=Pseudomonas aeruginosa TaxID=287 RepID=UPI00287F45E5|nr:hypothetical protein [Pseudomonas aeruginosa]EKL8566437.1 hypothetical protein [Pseudomonas aeruginosa]MCS7918703.1 hypothetical protein [Pseudomonas aeruginosa]